MAKGRRGGQNVTDPRDTVGQCGGNVIMCAAISENSASTHIPNIGPATPNTLYNDLVSENEVW